MKYEITKEQIKEAHSAACSQWKQKIEEWFPECFKPKYEIGKWYKVGKSIINYQGGTNAYGYYAELDKWEDVNDSWLVFEEEGDKLSLATTEEVESMLKKEAEKKGIVKGVKVSKLDDYYGGVLNTMIIGEPEFELKGDSLAAKSTNGYYIVLMKDGKWATIVETPKEMTLEEIEKQLGHKVKIVS